MAPTAVSSQISPTSPKVGKSEQVSSGTYSELPAEHAAANPIPALCTALVSERTSLAIRFRALFSLKHHASEHPPTPYTSPAIEAIAAAFSSSSALLKHELAYCLGQTRNLTAVPYLRKVLEDRGEDAMCRHEAAEALGALGDMESLRLLKERRDDPGELEVVKETCDIAVERIEWEHSPRRLAEQIRARYSPCSESL